MENPFIVIITCVNVKDVRNGVSSSAVLFPNFKEALDYARKDAENYKHLASQYTELIGDNRFHAEIKMYGKYINKTYRVSNMAKTGPCGKKSLQNRINTYDTYDYYDGGILL